MQLYTAAILSFWTIAIVARGQLFEICPAQARLITNRLGQPARCLPHRTDLCSRDVAAPADTCCWRSHGDYYCCAGVPQDICPTYENVTSIVYKQLYATGSKRHPFRHSLWRKRFGEYNNVIPNGDVFFDQHNTPDKWKAIDQGTAQSSHAGYGGSSSTVFEIRPPAFEPHEQGVNTVQPTKCELKKQGRLKTAVPPPPPPQPTSSATEMNAAKIPGTEDFVQGKSKLRESFEESIQVPQMTTTRQRNRTSAKPTVSTQSPKTTTAATEQELTKDGESEEESTETFVKTDAPKKITTKQPGNFRTDTMESEETFTEAAQVTPAAPKMQITLKPPTPLKKAPIEAEYADRYSNMQSVNVRYATGQREQWSWLSEEPTRRATATQATTVKPTQAGAPSVAPPRSFEQLFKRSKAPSPSAALPTVLNFNLPKVYYRNARPTVTLAK